MKLCQHNPLVLELDLFDKLVPAILKYEDHIWGFIEGKSIERVHLLFL